MADADPTARGRGQMLTYNAEWRRISSEPRYSKALSVDKTRCPFRNSRHARRQTAPALWLEIRCKRTAIRNDEMNSSVRAYYDRIASDYTDPASAYDARYHAKRFEKAVAMLNDITGRAFDFGCGNGELFRRRPDLTAEGCDLSPAMVAIANQLSPTAKIGVGGIEYFLRQTGPYEVAICLNTLPYLSATEEDDFFSHARKIAKYALISHGNKFFDLVTLNRYTVDFFRREMAPFVPAEALAALPRLLTNAAHPPSDDKNASDREIVTKRSVDPFTYRPEGFCIVKTVPFNTFPLPPAIMQARPDWQLAQVEADLPGSLGLLMSSQFQMLLKTS